MKALITIFKTIVAIIGFFVVVYMAFKETIAMYSKYTKYPFTVVLLITIIVVYFMIRISRYK